MEELLSAFTNDNDFYQEIVKSNIEDRRLIINSEISDDLLELVVLYILKWNQEDKHCPIEERKKIYLYINSNGGDALIGTQLLSTIQHSITPVVTVGIGCCASMASYILAAGKKRYCFPNTVVLYHDGQTGYVTSANKGKDIQRFYDNLDDRMKRFMMDHTNMTNEFLEEIKDREYYMFPEEAKELGIVDYIIGIDCNLDDIL